MYGPTSVTSNSQSIQPMLTDHVFILFSNYQSHKTMERKLILCMGVPD